MGDGGENAVISGMQYHSQPSSGFYDESEGRGSMEGRGSLDSGGGAPAVDSNGGKIFQPSAMHDFRDGDRGSEQHFTGAAGGSSGAASSNAQFGSGMNRPNSAPINNVYDVFNNPPGGGLAPVGSAQQLGGQPGMGGGQMQPQNGRRAFSPDFEPSGTRIGGPQRGGEQRVGQQQNAQHQEQQQSAGRVRRASESAVGGVVGVWPGYVL
jgi:hypothetical protein